MVQFGFGWWISQVITNGAREGARFGVVISDPPVSDGDVMARVQDYLNSSGIDASQATINVTYQNAGAVVGFAGCGSGCEVSVAISMPIQNLMPALLPLFPETLTAESVMRHE